MSDARAPQEPGGKDWRFDVDRSPTTVLYVTTGSPDETSVPSVLGSEHDMEVVITSTSLDEPTPDDRAFDCAVVDHRWSESNPRCALDLIDGLPSDVSVLIYADASGDTPRPDDCFRAGADDYLTADADTDDCTLLAHRIERCVGRVDGKRRHREIIDASPDAIVVADADTGEVVEANAAAADLLGRPEAEIVGMHQSELHPPGDRNRYRDLFDRHAGDGETIVGTFDDDEPLYVVTAAGDRIPVEINAKVIELDGHWFVQGHFRDVSERRERERKLQAILAGVPALAIVYNEDGEYQEVLTGREDLLVDTPETLLETDIHEALPSETADKLLGAVERTIETNETQHVDYQLTLDGERHWFDARTAPLPIDTYGSDCAVLLSYDVTERKRRERELRSFREAVEQAAHVILITDTDGQIEYVNPIFEEVTGYSKEEAIGQRPSLLNSGHHDHEFYRDLWETILAGEVWEGELVNERKDGERYHIEQTIAPITNDDGDVERFVAVNTDITDRKEHEQQLERERDRLDEFARTVAHDLRNPLSVALGHVELARMGGSSGQEVAPLDTAIEALDRMDTMIEEVLTLSRQGRTVWEPETVGLESVVESAWAHVETPDATLAVEDGVSDRSLDADESRLRELLENLFRNAIEHAGAEVTVGVGVLSNGEGFFVEDDGPGVPPEDRNRIFETGVTTAEGGTGFGLAIVAQIVSAHGWEITVTSADSDGTRFEIVTDPPDRGE